MIVEWTPILCSVRIVFVGPHYLIPFFVIYLESEVMCCPIIVHVFSVSMIAALSADECISRININFLHDRDWFHTSMKIEISQSHERNFITHYIQ
jgi:hypothetical protein